MKFAPVVLFLMLTACAQSAAQKPITNLSDWTGFVAPTDAVPPECVQAPRPEPTMNPAKAYSAADAAREDRKVRLALRKMRRDYRRCQVWAKGQR
jgi:hypothetical protein